MDSPQPECFFKIDAYKGSQSSFKRSMGLVWANTNLAAEGLTRIVGGGTVHEERGRSERVPANPVFLPHLPGAG